MSHWSISESNRYPRMREHQHPYSYKTLTTLFERSLEEEEEEKAAIAAANRQQAVLEELGDVTSQLFTLDQRVLRHRQNGNSSAAEAAWQQVQELEKQAQELNRESTCLTRYDLRSMGNFLSPPVNEYYTHTDGARYFAPDSSKIFALAAIYQRDCGFCELGLGKNRTVINPNTGKEYVCDLIYLKKQDDQIQYESHKLSYFGRISDAIHSKCSFWSSAASKIRQRIAKQREVFRDQVHPMLSTKFKEWQYSGFAICTSEEDFRRIGFQFTKTTAEKHYIIVMMYKPEKLGN